MTQSDIDLQLADMVATAVLKKVAPDTPLLESGLLDSVAAVDLMLSVESRFGCTIPLTEVEEHLYSLRTLSNYVNNHRVAG